MGTQTTTTRTRSRRSVFLFGLLTAAARAAFVGVSPSQAQTDPCPPPGCVVPLSFEVAANEYVVSRGFIVYSLRVGNRGTRPLDDVTVELRANRLTVPDVDCENVGWTSSSLPEGFTRWERWVGRLAPGQEVPVNLCLRFIGHEKHGHCDVAQRFVAHAQDGSQGELRQEAHVVTINEDCGILCSGVAGQLPRCCAVQLLFCLLHPTSDLCGSASPTSPLARLAARAAASVGGFLSSAADLALLHLLRDEVLATTPGGRQAIALYEAHGEELKRLLLDDAALREEALELLTGWRPLLVALVGGEATAATMSRDQVESLQSFLDQLRLVASPGLQSAIDRESQVLDLDSLVGLSAEQGLRRLDKLTCQPDGTTLCLSTGRMRVESEWETPDGGRGRGRAVPLTDDTGTFWFFGESNVETIVKVVDACGYNDRRWFFAAGLTDVGVVTTVTDTVTGAVRTYQNPLRRRFAPVQDTDAFDCSP